MLRKDKRSLSLCLALGDGCLHYVKAQSGIYGAMTIGHCKEQADYLSWKSSLLSKITGRDLKVRPAYKGGLQVSVSWRRFKAWRRRFYPNDRKNRLKMLPFIKHPELAIAIWLCDDGSSDKDGRLRLHTNAMSLEENEKLNKWLKDSVGVGAAVKCQHKKSTNRDYPYLQYNTVETLKLYGLIRPFIMRFQSMKNKFARTEHRFQRNCQSAYQAHKSLMI